MSFRVLIPARLGSTRLPGKPLIEINGRTMIHRVYQNCLASGADDVLVATDAESIKNEVESFGGNACLTSSNLASGSDRVARAIVKQGFTNDQVIVNVQGDEPFLSAKVIRQVGEQVCGEKEYVATVYEDCSEKMAKDANIVKVVTDHENFAMYFSRMALPRRATYDEKKSSCYKKHVGIYGYTVNTLLKFVDLVRPQMEKDEKLEQLRFLYHGVRIKVLKASGEVGLGIDTEEDLKRAKSYLAR